MSEGVAGALIGVIGAALISIVGWLSKKGRVIVTVTRSEHRVMKKDGEGGFVSRSERDDAVLYSYELELDLYNSSSEARIMRNITLGYRAEGKRLFSHTPMDSSTRRFVGSMTFHDPVSALNLQPKCVSHVRLLGSIWNTDERFSKLWDVDEIVLTYSDETGHVTKVPIDKQAHLIDRCLS